MESLKGHTVLRCGQCYLQRSFARDIEQTMISAADKYTVLSLSSQPASS